MTLAIEIIDACEVRGITYIHRIGKGLLGGLRLVFARLQVFEENVVGIIGSDESFDGESHRVSEQGRTDIAEVSAWHTYDEVICFSLLFHAGIGIEIVESLRQETRHVDAVRRGEFHVLIQFGIHKGILDEGLTIVEHTVNLNSSDVLSQCGELALLNRRDLTLGIEHIHMDAVNCNRRAMKRAPTSLKARVGP